MEEIVKGDDCKNILLEGINDLSDTVTKTMGPNGKTVIISDSNGNPYVTKDGVSVANAILFKNPVKNIAANLLKEVAQKTVEEAGDGTTTAICFAQSLINTGFKLMSEHKNIKFSDIKKELEILEKDIIKQLTISTSKLDRKKIKNVATIASNNDEAIGEMIHKAYIHSPVVKVEGSNKAKDELITINGLQLETGYFDKAFINNPSKQTIEYNNTLLLVIDGHLTSLKHIASFIENNSEGVTIIADHFSESVISILKKNYNSGNLKIALIKSPGFASHRKDLMKDIAMFSHGELVDSNKSMVGVNVGFVDSIKVMHNKTLIYKKGVNPEATKLANELKESLKEADKTQKELIQQRINNLIGKISVIKVGGNSELEMKEKRDRVEDAVLAVSCALEEGIVEGGGKTLYMMAPVLRNMFKECVKTPLYKIRENGADFRLSTNLFKKGIIDPSKVTRVAVQNAISIAKTILSTEAIVINDRLWR